MPYKRRPVFTNITTLARNTLAMKTFILIIAAAASLGIPKPITADINEDMLKQHNDYRKKHNANDLSIDDDVSTSCCNSLPFGNLRILLLPAAYDQRTRMGRPSGGHQLSGRLSHPER